MKAAKVGVVEELEQPELNITLIFCSNGVELKVSEKLAALVNNPTGLSLNRTLIMPIAIYEMLKNDEPFRSLVNMKISLLLEETKTTGVMLDRRL